MDIDMLEEIANEAANEVIEALRAQIWEEAEYMLTNYHDVEGLSDDELDALIDKTASLVLVDWDM